MSTPLDNNVDTLITTDQMIIDRLKKQLTFDEGKKNFPYTDSVGKLTIGIGRNLADRGLTDSEIAFLLENDIKEVVQNLSTNLPWFNNLDDVRQEVLINMCFNMGWPKLSQFKNTLNLVKEGKYNEASIAMLNSLWAKQVGNRAVRLANMMKTGESTLF